MKIRNSFAPVTLFTAIAALFAAPVNAGGEHDTRMLDSLAKEALYCPIEQDAENGAGWSGRVEIFRSTCTTCQAGAQPASERLDIAGKSVVADSCPATEAI